MRVIIAGGETFELGDVEATPTIGITDFSRRVTDDFGVTTIVERGFARKMSVKLGVPFDDVDVLQRRLANLRATPALWVADQRYASLSVTGFYKDFDIDLAVPPLSYCTLTIEGMAEAAAPADAGGDPAPADLASTLQLLQPVIMTNSVLVSSTVAENDAPEWQGAVSYSIGARAVKAATHRIYESVAAANAGNDPAGTSGKWLDLGPTNRWAMFDQALGTSTSASGSIVVTLDPGTAGAVALLDVSAATVRVQANGYDRTQAVGAGAITFLDLPATGRVTVTIAGDGVVSVGTLLVGPVVSLGITESSPTAGITDFSKKTVDDFGEVTIVQRAWSKKMAAKALIRTDAIDVVANRIAAVRARPCLWIGQAGLDSLTVYGFFKDFSIEVGETLSKLSLSIEGLSTAAPVKPLGAGVNWGDIADPAGTKPADNATVGAPIGTDIAGVPAETAIDTLQTTTLAHLRSMADAELARIRLRRQLFPSPDGASIYTLHRREEAARIEQDTAFAETFELLGAVGRNGTAFVFGDNAVFAGPDGAGGTAYVSVSARFDANEAKVEHIDQVLVGPGGAFARSLNVQDVNGRVVGTALTNDGRIGAWVGAIDQFRLEHPVTGEVYFYADATGKVRMRNVEVDTLKIGAMDPEFIAKQIAFNGSEGTQVLPGGVIMKWGKFRAPINGETSLSILFAVPFPTSCDSIVPTPYIEVFSDLNDLWIQAIGEPTRMGATFATQAAATSNRRLDGFNWLAFGR